MKKRFIPTAIAFIILIGLAIYSNYYETDDILPAGEVKPEFIIGGSEAKVKSISFGNKNSYNLKIVFAGDSAKIVVPSEYACDYSEAVGIARHFTELESLHYFEKIASSSVDYGFTETAPRVRLETEGASYEVTLGNKVAIGDSLYLKKENDNRIFIVPSHIKGSFYKSLEDLRERALYTEDFGAVKEIDYSSASGTFKLVWDDSRSEWLITDTKYSADNVDVANLINNTRNLRISNFVDSQDMNNQDYGLQKPDLHIKFLNKDGKSFELKAGALQGVDTFVSADNKFVQRVNTLKLSALYLSVNDIRDKYLEIPSLGDLTELVVDTASGSITIKKVDKAWLNGNIRIKDDDIKNLVNAFSRSKVVKFVSEPDLNKLGLEALESCSKIEFKTVKNVTSIYLGKSDEILSTIKIGDEVVQVSSDFEKYFSGFVKKLYSESKVVEEIKK